MEQKHLLYFRYLSYLSITLCIAQQNLSIGVNVVCDGSPSRMRRVRRISLGMTTLPRSSARVKYSQKYFFECEKALILLTFLALGVFSVKDESAHPMCYFRTNSLFSRLFSFRSISGTTSCVSFPAPSTYCRSFISVFS